MGVLKKVAFYVSSAVWVITLVLILVMLKYSVVGIVSDSMSPTINRGEYVIASDCKVSDCEVGDIVVYKSKSGINIIHRVVGVYWGELDGSMYEYLIVRGDANVEEDFERVDNTNIRKKVVYIPTTSAVKNLMDAFASKNRTMYFVGYALLLCIMPVVLMDSFGRSVKYSGEKKASAVRYETVRVSDLLEEEVGGAVSEQEYGSNSIDNSTSCGEKSLTDLDENDGHFDEGESV